MAGQLRGYLRDVRRGRLPGRVVVEGARLVAEAAAAQARIEALVWSPRVAGRPLPQGEIERILNHPLAREVGDAEMDRLAVGPSHQGVLAVVVLPQWTPADCLRGLGWLVVLDGVQDPLNFGAIARAARAFGASGLWYRPGGAQPLSTKVYRASAGALLDLPVAPVADLGEALRDAGRPVWVAAADGEPLPPDWPPAVSGALVLGNEGRGTAIALGRRIAIPMRRGTESLNVAQAAAILLSRTLRS